MQIDFLFLATARKEIRKSFDWYDERSEESGDRFLEAIDNAVIAISGNPEAYQNRKGNTREFVMDVFPFIIVYRFSKKRILFTFCMFSIQAAVREKNTRTVSIR